MSKTLKILGKEIKPGSSHQLSLRIAKLHTRDSVETPVIIERAMKDGPVILFNAGVHGDEVNGVEIVRRLVVSGMNKPLKGTVICVPVLNTFAFANLSRTLPDGRDLNRVFPGTKNGSLASLLAYNFTREILKRVDYIIDYHTGGADRSNAAQIRCTPDDPNALALANIFAADYILDSKTIPKSVRATAKKLGKCALLFEGGKSLLFNEDIIQSGVDGAKRVLHHLGMCEDSIAAPNKSIHIKKSTWLRAKASGMFHLKIENGVFAQKDELLATITDPYGDFCHEIRAPFDCHLICSNTASTVYRGDAVFNVGLITEE